MCEGNEFMSFLPIDVKKYILLEIKHQITFLIYFSSFLLIVAYEPFIISIQKNALHAELVSDCLHSSATGVTSATVKLLGAAC